MGAFKAIYAEPCKDTKLGCNHNNELQTYLPESATQASNGEITLKAERHSDGWITSARLDSFDIWTTSQDDSIKTRGYVEVRSNLPAKVNGDQFRGSWPAIWMLGSGPGWPAEGELDIVELVNGNPRVVMTTHSSSHHGGNGQHPSDSTMQMNANFMENELISGFEWNLQNSDQIDLTWWMTWFDLGSNSWESKHTTLVIQANHGQDYHEFYNSFMGNGFYMIINLAEGGDMPGTNDVFVDGQPQYVIVKSAKVYGF